MNQSTLSTEQLNHILSILTSMSTNTADITIQQQYTTTINKVNELIQHSANIQCCCQNNTQIIQLQSPSSIQSRHHSAPTRRNSTLLSMRSIQAELSNDIYIKPSLIQSTDINRYRTKKPRLRRRIDELNEDEKWYCPYNYRCGM